MTLAALYAVSLLAIVLGSELFTNAVEWAGFQMRLASGATGSLIAALGTALPETVVPIIALLTRAPSADSVAIGAVLGAPFLLLTLGVAVTGGATLLRPGRRRLVVDRAQARRDLGVFIVAFSAVLISIALPRSMRVAVGTALLAVYGGYVIATLRGGAPEEDMPEPLHLLRWGAGRDPGPSMITAQLLLAVALIIMGSTLFVHALDTTAAELHANPLLLAVVLIPVATELPETLNSVLWVRGGDDGLAFGNVAGSATFQACFLGFIGLSFTSWRPGLNGVIPALLTLGTATGVLVLMRGGSRHGGWLGLAALPWIGFVILQLASGGRLGG